MCHLFGLFIILFDVFFVLDVKVPSDPPLPVFSGRVLQRLQADESHMVWSTIIEESAHFYLDKYPNLNSPMEYFNIGRAMFKKYPSIGRDGGKFDWVCFNNTITYL